MVDAKALISKWREELDDEQYVARPEVQDKLLALWGEVGEGGTKVVEQWLAVTPHRNLFASGELRQMLDEVEQLVDA